MSTLGLVLPDFALIGLGVALRRWAWRSPGFWSDLERLVYLVLFPALLLRTTLAADLRAGGALPLLAAGVAATLGGAAVASLARPLLRPDPVVHASGVQNAFRFNTYLGLGVAQSLGPTASASMGLLIAVNVPLVNVLAVRALARGAAGADGRRGGVARELARNPLILATVTGLVGNLAGVRLPQVLDAGLGRLAAAAVPLGLLAVGAALQPSGLAAGRRRVAAYFGAVKLLAVPALALAGAAALSVPLDQRQVLVAFAALPPASSAYVLAVRMSGDGPFVAAQLSLATAAALVTLPLWLALTDV